MLDDELARKIAGSVSGARLVASLRTLAAIGGRPDGGVARETLTDADLQARRHLVELARTRGWKVSVDPCANLFFRREGTRPELPPVLSGSHIDSQPAGGWLDGVYGVMAGIEVLLALDDAGIATEHSIEICAWTNEEGSRFAPGAMGSSTFVKPSVWEDLRGVRDAAGIPFEDACNRALADLDPAVVRGDWQRPIAAYIEAHIEQGPVLEAARVPLGVVTGIQGVRWFTVDVHGVAGHAGTVPRALRADAMQVAINKAQAVLDLATEDDRIRLTVGRWIAQPNSINTIAGEVRFTIDLRHPEEATLERLETKLRALLESPDSPCRIEVGRTLCQPPTQFDSVIVETIARACNRTGAGSQRLISGAFHDAMHLARHCPSAMLFVPSREGISHNPREDTDPVDLHLGAQALAIALTELAGPVY